MKRTALGLAIALACAPILGQAETFYLYCVGSTKVAAASRTFISQVFQVSGVDFANDGTAGKTLAEIEKTWGDFTGCDVRNDHARCHCTYSESLQSATRLRTDYLTAMEDSLTGSASGQMNPSGIRSIDLPGESISAAVAKGKAARE
jgi:hypothetical protein